MPKQPNTFELLAGVTIDAEAADGNAGPRRFNATVYNGRELVLPNFDYPVVLDLASLQSRNSLVANLDHDKSKRVGNIDDQTNDGQSLILAGVASAATAARDEVIQSAKDGFRWQASIEAAGTSRQARVDFVRPGTTVSVNKQTFKGPVYVARHWTLKGFAFVSHGADDDTTVKIAATADSTKESDMDPKFKKWLEDQDLKPTDIEADANLCAVLEKTWESEATPPKKKKKQAEGQDVIAAAYAEQNRVKAIDAVTAAACREYPDQIEVIEKMHRRAVENEIEAEDYDTQILKGMRGLKPTGTFSTRNGGSGSTLNNTIIEAAICRAGQLSTLEKRYDDQTLSAVDKLFPRGIGLKQLWFIAAEANGYRANYSMDITQDCQEAAFGRGHGSTIAASAFSTISLPYVLSGSANAFMEEGWKSQDMTWQRISAYRPLKNFQPHQMYRMTMNGDLEQMTIGANGELPHATLSDTGRTIQADTQGVMLAVTRKHLMNDDLGALTQLPFELGALCNDRMNNLFWKLFLNNSTFFSSGNANVSTGTPGSVLSLAGLNAAEAIFAAQTKPGNSETPISINAEVLVVPKSKQNTALTLMNSSQLIDGTATAAQGSTNVYSGRYRVESSAYMENANYTGYSADAWYMLANPARYPVIQVGFVNGRMVPFIETADAPFNQLGAQMRAYFDPAVALAEPKHGVRSAGA